MSDILTPLDIPHSGNYGHTLSYDDFIFVLKKANVLTRVDILMEEIVSIIDQALSIILTYEKLETVTKILDFHQEIKDALVITDEHEYLYSVILKIFVSFTKDYNIAKNEETKKMLDMMIKIIRPIYDIFSEVADYWISVGYAIQYEKNDAIVLQFNIKNIMTIDRNIDDSKNKLESLRRLTAQEDFNTDKIRNEITDEEKYLEQLKKSFDDAIDFANDVMINIFFDVENSIKKFKEFCETQ